MFKNHDDVQMDDVTILPLIDLNPGDYSCLYSVIHFVDNEVRRIKLPGTTLTFDQPLFIKAVEIVLAKEIRTVVIRLAGFHTLMSAIGSVIHLMKNSGIEETSTVPLGCALRAQCNVRNSGEGQTGINHP